MVDFRFHIISIVAVFLALGLGILTGSGFIGDELVENLQGRVEAVRSANERVRENNELLEEQMDDAERFAREVQPLLIDGLLADTNIVLVVFEGTPGIDELRGIIERAGGEVASQITVTQKFALSNEAEREQLSLILRSVEADAAELRTEAGRLLGTRLRAAAGLSRGAALGRQLSTQRLDRLLTDLAEADFITIDRDDGRPVVPALPSFVVVGGGEEAPEFEPVTMAMTLAHQLDGGPVNALVAEALPSAWGLVESIRGDDAVASEVSTVGGVNTLYGQIAVAMAIDRLDDEPAGHYGPGAGASSIIPVPTTSP